MSAKKHLGETLSFSILASATFVAILLEVVFGLAGLDAITQFFVVMPATLFCLVYLVVALFFKRGEKKKRDLILLFTSLALFLTFFTTSIALLSLSFIQSTYPVAREIRYAFPGSMYLYVNDNPQSLSSTFENAGLIFFSPDLIIWFLAASSMLTGLIFRAKKRKVEELSPEPSDITSNLKEGEPRL